MRIPNPAALQLFETDLKSGLASAQSLQPAFQHILNELTLTDQDLYAVQVMLNRYYTHTESEQLLSFPTLFHFLENQFVRSGQSGDFTVNQLRERVRIRFSDLLRFEPISMSLMEEEKQFFTICIAFIRRVLDRSVIFWGNRHPARNELLGQLESISRAGVFRELVNLSHEIQSQLEQRFGPQTSTKVFQEVFAGFAEVFAGLQLMYQMVPLLPPGMSQNANGSDPLFIMNRASMLIQGYQHSLKHNQIAHQLEQLQEVHQKTIDALQSSRQRQSILEAIGSLDGNAKMVMKPDGRLCWVNAKAAQLLGYERTHLETQSLSNLFPAIDEEAGDHIDDLWEVNRNISIGEEIQTKFVNQAGKRMPVWLQTDKLSIGKESFFLLRIRLKDQ